MTSFSQNITYFKDKYDIASDLIQSSWKIRRESFCNVMTVGRKLLNENSKQWSTAITVFIINRISKIFSLSDVVWNNRCN